MADAGMEDAFASVDAGLRSTIFQDASAITRLARLDEMPYARERKAEAKRLGVSVAVLDREVQSQRRFIRAETFAAAGKPWLRECQTTQQGELRGNVTNALLPLRLDPRVANIVRYDEMLRLPILMQPIPGTQIDGNTPFQPRPIEDADYTFIQEWTHKEGLETISKEIMCQAIDARAKETRFHPIRQWLDLLEWDGKQRIGNWLTTYLGVEETPYSTGIGFLFLVAMVARVREPGCKADYAIVLEGPQGARKSTACSILGGEWFSDAMPDIRAGKDASQHLNGKWLIEVAEMSALDKAEAAALKAFITRRVERYRPPFGRAEVIEPRQCLFIGTTNKTAYLRDETGGRRFWPVLVGKIDTDALARDRVQMFAEADYCYNQGQQWWPDAKFEAEHIAAEQSARYEADSWEDAIGEWLDKLHDNPQTTMDDEKAMAQCTVLTVARKALFFDAQKLGTSEQRRVKAAMERIGWKPGKRTATDRFFVPGPGALARQTAREAEKRDRRPMTQ